VGVSQADFKEGNAVQGPAWLSAKAKSMPQRKGHSTADLGSCSRSKPYSRSCKECSCSSIISTEIKVQICTFSMVSSPQILLQCVYELDIPIELVPCKPFWAQSGLPSTGHRSLILTVMGAVPGTDEVREKQMPQPGPAPAPGPTPKKFCEMAAWKWPPFRPHATEG